MSEFSREGVKAYHNIIPQNLLAPKLEDMRNEISNCARDLSCDTNEYLASVSRWASPSPVTQHFAVLIDSILQPKLEAIVGASVTLVKSNIICKNRYATHSVPCHQDISYQTDYPYHFSCWLALTDVGETDGPLICLPKSHYQSPLPAIDFWDINFQDNIATSPDWKANAKKFVMNSGDAVLFDARVTHGSAASMSGNDRYALVTRWIVSKNLPYECHVSREVGMFGMWNCQEKTADLLRSLLKSIAIKPPDDFIQLLDQTVCVIDRFSWLENPELSKKLLKRVKILHLASQRHNAGDAHGTVYRELWNNLLCYIENILIEEVTYASN